MKTETDTAESSTSAPASKLRTAGRVTLAIINPFSDLMVIYRRGVQPTVGKLKLLWQIVNQSGAPGEALSWQQAVDSTGKSPAQLLTNFRRMRVAWWCLMTLASLFACMLTLMVVFAYSSLPTGTLIRALVALLVLVSLGAFGFVKTLAMNYRIWQLEEQRVSEQEHGTFLDFRAENRWCLQVLTLGLAKQ